MSDQPARLAPMLIDAWRELRKAWAEARAYAELLGLALGMNAELEKQLAAARRTIIHLREQIRKAA